MNAAANRSARRAYLTKLRTRRFFFILLFVLLVLFPLIVAAISNTLNDGWRDWTREAGSFMGMLGLSLMILSSVPIIRERMITSSFNLDIVYKFHHAYSSLGFFFAFAHLGLLWAHNPEVARLMNVFENYPLYAKGGMISLVTAGILVYTSYFRKNFKFGYDYWKIAHSLLAMTMIVFGLIHTFGINYYSGHSLIHIYYIVLTVFAALSILTLRVITPTLQLNKPYSITDIVLMNNDTAEMKLVFNGKPEVKPVAYRAGQIGWITVHHSPYSFRRHPFSFTSADTDHSKVSFAIRNLGDFTASVKYLRSGDRVYLEGSFGVFNLDKLGDEGFVMIAGGIGIAPVMGILRTMDARKDKRKVVLYYGSRDEESIGFYEEIKDIATRINLTPIHVLERTDNPNFEKGYVTQTILEKYYPANKERYDVFICGPGPMVEIILPALKNINVPKENIWPEFYDMG